MSTLYVRLLLRWDHYWQRLRDEDEICEAEMVMRPWLCQRRWAHRGAHCHYRSVVDPNGDRVITTVLWRSPAGSPLSRTRKAKGEHRWP